MKTIFPHEITDADRPFLVAYGNPDGSVTLYYPGDIIPTFPNPTQSEIDAALSRILKDDADAFAAKTYGKLKAMVGMTPAEVHAWVVANVTNLAQAQDAIATLAIAISVLARRL